MNTYKIEINHNKCIGNGICAATLPTQFILKENKAMVVDGKLNNKIMIAEKELTESAVNEVITAAHLCPANAIRVIDLTNNQELVETKLKKENARIINAQYDDTKDFVLDPKGYFLIRLLPESKEIEAGFCGTKNKVEIIVRGKKPIDIYHAIAHLDIISIKEHHAYLGRELQKAYIALQKGIKYVQDDELEF